MDKIVEKIAALGVPGLMFFVALSMTGLSGAAAITAALALLGPGGMIGGIVTLLFASAISAALAEYGFDALFRAIIKKMIANGESKESIEEKVRKVPVSRKLKARVIEELRGMQ